MLSMPMPYRSFIVALQKAKRFSNRIASMGACREPSLFTASTFTKHVTILTSTLCICLAFSFSVLSQTGPGSRFSSQVTQEGALTNNSNVSTIPGPPGSPGPPGAFNFVASLPALCTPGITASVQLSVAPYLAYYCSATNTWTLIGGSGSGSGCGTLPISPNGVPQICTSTPSGGVGQAGAFNLGGVPVNNNNETTCATQTLNVLDRATAIFCTGGSTSTFTLPVHTTSGFAASFPFILFNLNSGAMTLSPNTDTIDTATLFPNWGDHLYNNASGNWQTAQFPLFAAFPNCTDSAGNHLNFTASTGVFSCGTTSSGGGNSYGSAINPGITHIDEEFFWNIANVGTTAGQYGWTVNVIGAQTNCNSNGYQDPGAASPHDGVYEVVTDATAAHGCAIALGRSNATLNDPFIALDTTTNYDGIWIYKLSTTTTLSTLAGFVNGNSTQLPTNYIGVRFDNTGVAKCGATQTTACADTNFTFVTCKAAACQESTTNSIAATSANWVKVRIRSTVAGSWAFSICAGDGCTLGTETTLSNGSSQVPSVEMSPGFQITAGAASSVFLLCDKFEIVRNPDGR
jgi:hypothetical protein